MFRALDAPARMIASNAGMEGAVVVQQIERETGNIGLNAATGEFEDLVKAGATDADLAYLERHDLIRERAIGRYRVSHMGQEVLKRSL